MTITRRLIEHVRITGKMAESKKAFGYCEKHGYRVTRSGAYRRPDRIGGPVDIERFLITAEREKETT